jgi:hypothetical protein
MKARAHVIEMEELVLTGNPEQRTIESAVLRALREAGVADTLSGVDAHVAVASEVTRVANEAVQRRGI